MSDPIEKLSKTCKIIGDECHDLVKKRKDKRIGDIRFVNEYFQLLDKMKESKKREDIIKSLEEYAKQNLKKDTSEWLK